MQAEKLYNSLLNAALNYLTIKGRTKHEVFLKLDSVIEKINDCSNEEKLEAKEKVLQRLEKLNLLNDLDYSRRFVSESLNKGKGDSNLKIREKLRQRGIPSEIISLVIKEIPANLEDDNIEKLIIKKERSLQKYSINEKKQRIIAFLLRKGFSYGKIRSVVDRVVGVK